MAGDYVTDARKAALKSKGFEKSFAERLRVDKVKNWDEVPLSSLLSSRPRAMWAHTGRCQCGRRTWLFGRCIKCIRAEAQEKLAEGQEECVSEQKECKPSGFWEIPSVPKEETVEPVLAFDPAGPKELPSLLTPGEARSAHFVSDVMLANLSRALAARVPRGRFVLVQENWGAWHDVWGKSNTLFKIPPVEGYRYRTTWAISKTRDKEQPQVIHSL